MVAIFYFLFWRLKPIYNPQDTKDDLKVEWTPQELIHATVALSNYNVKPLYTRKDPNTVKKVLYIVLLVEKYKPLLKELLEDRRYFERYPEDLKDEPIVYIALLDLLCRGDGPSIEEQLDKSAREEYKNCGLKVIYLQVQKYRTQYYEMVHRRLRHSHVTSFYQLLPSQVPITLDLQYPKKFDMWINKNKLGAKWVDDRVLLEEQSHFKPAGAVGKRAVTYKEIKILPFFYELEASNFFDFMESTNYHNHVFIPADRNHCLAITDLVRQLIKLNAGKGSVIQTHILSLSATAYFAYLLSVCFNPPMKLKVFGADKMKESFDCYFDLLCLKNIKVFSKRFYIQNPRQKDIAKTVSVLVNPETTFNPSLNIIDEAVKRGCDIAYLQSTYELLSQEDVHSLHFSFQQKSDLRDLARYNMQRALTIPKVKFVVYQSFDQSETLNDNNGSYVVNYMTECQHDSEVSINSDLNKSDPEYTNYKYSATLDSCFKQSSAVQHPFSSEVSGSDPPFIAIFCRTEAVDLVDDDHEIDSCSDKSDKEQLKILKEIEEQLKHEMEDEASDVEIYEMDKMDPEKEAKFETFVRDIFEKAMGIKLIETESSESSEDNKPQTENKQKAVEKEKDKLKKLMFFIKDVKQLVALQRTSKRELVKLARKLNQIRDNAECYLPANEECPEKNEEKKYLNKQAHGESGQPKPIETGRLIDIVPHRTPTEGLSQLAKELYELRDIVEYYYNSEVEPLDWRAFIERRVDE